MSSFKSNLPTIGICNNTFYIDHDDFYRHVSFVNRCFMLEQVYSNLRKTLAKKSNELSIFIVDRGNYSGNRPTLSREDLITLSAYRRRIGDPILISTPKCRALGKSLYVATKDIHGTY